MRIQKLQELKNFLEGFEPNLQIYGFINDLDEEIQKLQNPNPGSTRSSLGLADYENAKINFRSAPAKIYASAVLDPGEQGRIGDIARRTLWPTTGFALNGDLNMDAVFETIEKLKKEFCREGKLRPWGYFNRLVNFLNYFQAGYITTVQGNDPIDFPYIYLHDRSSEIQSKAHLQKKARDYVTVLQEYKRLQFNENFVGWFDKNLRAFKKYVREDTGVSYR